MNRTLQLPAGLPITTAVLVLVLSAGFYGFRWWRLDDVLAETPAWAAPGEAAAVDEAPVVLPSPAQWPAPAAQNRGTLWRFGLFTPPKIHFDRISGTFEIIPPRVIPDAIEQKPAEAMLPGLRLLAVQREPYALQLVGYIGDESDLLGTFENRATGETLVLREGGRVEPAGLVIERLFLVRVEETPPESMSIRETRASALVREMQSGRTIRLRQGVSVPGDRLLAVLSRDDSGSATVTVREGERVDVGAERYRIGKIRLAPPAVDVTKEDSGDADPARESLPMTFTLQAPQ